MCVCVCGGGGIVCGCQQEKERSNFRERHDFQRVSRQQLFTSEWKQHAISQCTKNNDTRIPSVFRYIVHFVRWYEAVCRE